MKRILILTLAVITSISANAQLKVESSGSVKIGGYTPWPYAGKVNITGSNETLESRVFSLTNNPARMWAVNSQYGFSFGMGTDGRGHIHRNIHGPVSIMSFNSNGYVGINRAASYRLDVNGSIRVNYTIYSSDSTLKSDIKSLSGQSKDLFSLNSVSYRLRDMRTEEEKKPQYETLNREKQIGKVIEHDNRIHYGFLAQEVREIYPELVFEDNEGILGIDYVGFIPLVIEEVKSQKAEIEELKEEIEELRTMVDDQLDRANSVGTLHQNIPNPFHEETKIQVDIAESVGKAVLYVYDMNGKQIKSIDIRERGSSTIVLKGSELNAGMYMYSLIADEQLVDTKTMILTD